MIKIWKEKVLSFSPSELKQLRTDYSGIAFNADPCKSDQLPLLNGNGFNIDRASYKVESSEFVDSNKFSYPCVNIRPNFLEEYKVDELEQMLIDSCFYLSIKKDAIIYPLEVWLSPNHPWFDCIFDKQDTNYIGKVTISNFYLVSIFGLKRNSIVSGRVAKCLGFC